MDQKEIKKRLKEFSNWHYKFDLNGINTPISDFYNINRHVQREKHLFDPIIDLFGGNLKGKRVLDLGCNAGFWSLLAVKNHCDFILGIDGRKSLIEQAELVFEVNNIDKTKYQFITKSIFDIEYSVYGQFDIVFCLGLMYHINKPIELLEKVSLINSDIIIIDTAISMVRGSFFELSIESLEDSRNALDSELVFRPTKTAIRDILNLKGYDVRILKPEFSDYTGAKDYGKGMRRGFIGAKKTDLTKLQATTEDFPFEEVNSWDPEYRLGFLYFYRTLRLYIQYVIKKCINNLR